MNRDPFLRLALIASVSAYAIAIAVIWEALGWRIGLVGLAAGTPGAAVLTLELRDEPREGVNYGRFRRGPRPE